MGQPGQNRSKRGPILLALFALPFAAVGVGTAVGAARAFARGDWRQGWFLALFALVFGGVGFGLLIGTFFARRDAQREEHLQATYPDAPWLWKTEWAEGRIRGEGRRGMIGIWIFALFWNCISAPLIFIVPQEVLDKGNTLALIGLLFPLIGLGLLAAALRATLRWRKFGESIFEMAAVPGVLGGRLAGAIRTRVHLRPEDGFHVTLTCINRVVTGSGDSASTTEHVRWQEQRHIGRELLEHDPSRSAIPVLFTIPYACQPTDDRNSRNRILWRLELDAAVPGIDYHARFEVPVFRTPASRPDVTPDDDAIGAYLADVSLPQAAQSRIAVTPRADGGADILFPAARNPGAGIGVAVFTTIWTGAVWLLWHLGAPGFFTAVFALMDVLLLYGTVWMWLGVSRVRVDRDGIRVRNSVLGVGRTRRIPRDAIRELTIRIGMQFGQTPFYDITIVRRDDRKVTAGGSIRDKREAEAIAAAMGAALGRPGGERR